MTEVDVRNSPSGPRVIIDEDGNVTSVFGRTGIVVAQNGDYEASQVANDSSVAGSTVADALNTLSVLVSPFTINSFAFNPGSQNTKEVGDALATPAFAASYSLAATTATLSDNAGNPSQNLALPATGFASVNSYTRTVPGQTYTFTLAATKSGYPNPANRTLTTTWFCRVYWGAVNDPGVYNSAFVNALSNSVLRNVAQGAYAVNAGSGQSVFFCTLSSNVITALNFTVNGLPFAISKVGDPIAVTNAFGVTLNFQVWRSDSTSLGAFTFVVS